MKWMVLVAVIAGAAWWFWPRGFGDLGATEAGAVRSGLQAAGLSGPVVLVAPVLAVTDRQGKLVCGWARDGGPVGEALGNQAFVGLLTRDGFSVARIADGADQMEAVRTLCASNGMRL